jgi:hypothetical protein
MLKQENQLVAQNLQQDPLLPLLPLAQLASRQLRDNMLPS